MSPPSQALLTVSRGGREHTLKLDSGILRAPASVRRCGEGCCQKASAGRSLDVSLHPPQGSLALIFSHPPQSLVKGSCPWLGPLVTY